MTQSKAWERFRLGRNTGARGVPKKRLLIVCEGEKTEPNYFKSFRVTSVTVIIKGLGLNTVNLISAAISLKEKEKREGTPYDQIWCVFDRDSFSTEDFNGALKLAEENSIEVAYSNESFEVWYLLHFSYLHSTVSRKDYSEKLTKCLGKQYMKNSKVMYEDLLEKQSEALKNSKKLLASYESHNPETDNPCTTVFKLVEELNKNL